MKNDSKLQAIIDAANEWIDEDQNNHTCIILTFDEIGSPQSHSFTYADRSDIKWMLLDAFKDDDFLHAAKAAMEWIEKDKDIKSEPTIFV